MDNKNLEKVKIILLGVIAVILLCLLVVISLRYKSDNKNDVQNSDNNSSGEVVPDNNYDMVEKEDNNSNIDVKPNKKPDNSVNGDQSVNNNSTNNNTGNNNSGNSNSSSGSNSSVTEKEEVTYQESDVVSYFEKLNQDIDTYKNSDNTSIKEKIKTSFITVVDFLFYDGVIKGHTFDELTNDAKIKVLTLALKIDNKIDKYFPNYKESIKEKTSAFKEKVAILYLEATAKLCESVGEDSCNLARENFKDMKESFGFTWEGIKTVASTSASKLSVLFKEWYQSIKN